MVGWWEWWGGQVVGERCQQLHLHMTNRRKAITVITEVITERPGRKA